jgi:hypothetical protein
VSLRRRLLPSTPRWEAVLGEWLARIDGSGGPNDDFTADAATDLVETLLTRPAGFDAALGRFGRSLGAAGYTLDQVAAWVQLLATIVPGRANRFGGFDAGLALSRGWSQGHLTGLQASAATDPTTGLHTELVLQIRLQQAYAYATSLGVSVNWLYSMVVVSASVPPTEPFRREATLAVLGDLVQRHWNRGETAAALGDRVLVLCANASDLPEHTAAFSAQAERLSLLSSAAILAWTEPLPDDADQLERFLRVLYCC